MNIRDMGYEIWDMGYGIKDKTQTGINQGRYTIVLIKNFMLPLPVPFLNDV